ncbi:DNA replication complex GINS family protein [Halobellus captivus]|uniref:DNA replication complex GINS family protein n=1 Tax=Halobellus captivus TaxID=2592614 RepID=UPI00119D72E9|nr:DNA replication complex GINS family protein [Halobellus captivus]
MNLDELRSVRRTERQKDSLQHLRDSFYEDVAAFIAERKAERRRAADAAEDPFADPDVGRLTDEIETAEDVVESIYERRVGKVVKLASFAAADMSADTEGLTAEERELFDGLVGRIKQNRQAVLDVLAGEGGSEGGPAATTTEADAAITETDATTEAATTASSTPEPTTSAPEPLAPDDVLSEAMGGDGASSAETDTASPDTDGASADASGSVSEPADSPVSESAESVSDASGVPADVPPDAPPDATAPDAPVIGDGTDGTDGLDGRPDDTERVTLRITEDVGQIFGVDEREYDLESEDVVTLPTTNAGPLLDRDAAERLD